MPGSSDCWEGAETARIHTGEDGRRFVTGSCISRKHSYAADVQEMNPRPSRCEGDAVNLSLAAF